MPSRYWRQLDAGKSTSYRIGAGLLAEANHAHGNLYSEAGKFRVGFGVACGPITVNTGPGDTQPGAPPSQLESPCSSAEQVGRGSL